MIEKKTTEKIIDNYDIYLWSDEEDCLVRNDANADKEWISVESLKEFLNNNSNPCMKCGSVQCAVCSDDLIKNLKVVESEKDNDK